MVSRAKAAASERVRFSEKDRAVDAHIGLRLKRRRVELEMTQSALANDLGVTFQQIQKYEKGIDSISSGRLLAIASVLQVPISYFFEDIPEATLFEGEMQNLFAVFETDEGRRLAKAFIRITEPAVRHHIVQLAAALARKKN